MARKPPECKVTVRVADGRLWEELPEAERQERANRMLRSWIEMVGIPWARAQAARQVAGD